MDLPSVLNDKKTLFSAGVFLTCPLNTHAESIKDCLHVALTTLYVIVVHVAQLETLVPVKMLRIVIYISNDGCRMFEAKSVPMIF